MPATMRRRPRRYASAPAQVKNSRFRPGTKVLGRPSAVIAIAVSLVSAVEPSAARVVGQIDHVVGAEPAGPQRRPTRRGPARGTPAPPRAAGRRQSRRSRHAGSGASAQARHVVLSCPPENSTKAWSGFSGVVGMGVRGFGLVQGRSYDPARWLESHQLDARQEILRAVPVGFRVLFHEACNEQTSGCPVVHQRNATEQGHAAIGQVVMLQKPPADATGTSPGRSGARWARHHNFLAITEDGCCATEWSVRKPELPVCRQTIRAQSGRPAAACTRNAAPHTICSRHGPRFHRRRNPPVLPPHSAAGRRRHRPGKAQGRAGAGDRRRRAGLAAGAVSGGRRGRHDRHRRP